MPSPYPVAATFGSLIFLMRHEPAATADQAALARVLLAALDGGAFRVEAEPEQLLVNGTGLPLDSPGATLVNEQMLLHGLREVSATQGVAGEHLVRLASVLAAFSGTYDSFDAVVAALGPSAGVITLVRGANEFEVFRSRPFRPRTVFDPVADPRARMEMPDLQREEVSEFERIGDVSLEGGTAEDDDGLTTLSGEYPVPQRPALDTLIARGREAIEKEDWPALLETALLIVEGETEATTDLGGSTHRIELKRLLYRKNLIQVARLAHGDRKQEAITLLRRFGAEATEILMDLLVEAKTIGERRAYYSALIQMSEGTEVIIDHLGHGEWYAVRNAADLCGEMQLAAAVPELGRLVAHTDERVRKSVAEALGKIGTTAAMEPLKKLLEDPAHAVRLQAVAYLGGRRAKGMTPSLAELLKREEHAGVVQEAIAALGRIGTLDAIALLREAAAPGGKVVGRKPVAVRLAAIRALAKVGPQSADALAALSRDESEEVRTAVAEALKALRP